MRKSNSIWRRKKNKTKISGKITKMGKSNREIWSKVRYYKWIEGEEEERKRKETESEKRNDDWERWREVRGGSSFLVSFSFLLFFCTLSFSISNLWWRVLTKSTNNSLHFLFNFVFFFWFVWRFQSCKDSTDANFGAWCTLSNRWSEPQQLVDDLFPLFAFSNFIWINLSYYIASSTMEFWSLKWKVYE